jgi:nucleotide-binding universal stress UspA family protein
MKLLIGVDGSTGAQEAVRQAGQLASPERDTVALYYAPPPLPLREDHRLRPAQVDRVRRAISDAVFEDAERLLPASLLGHTERIVGAADARRGLVATATGAKADLVVVGARGLSRAQRLMLGSVSTTVVHESPVPVLVVRRRPHRRDGEPFRVLLAYDGQPASRQAAEFAERLTWPADASGRVVTVVPTIFGAELPEWLVQRARDAETEAFAQVWVREHEAIKAARGQEALDLEKRLAGPFRGQTPLVYEGEPAEQILLVAEEERSDLIVLGARQLTAVSRLLLGSTSQKILAHAPCSLLVVRQHVA